MTKLINKQLVLMQAIANLSEAANIIDNDEVMIMCKKGEQILPIAPTEVQNDFLTESACADLRGAILETLDNKVAQLNALGVTISEEALADITSTDNNSN